MRLFNTSLAAIALVSALCAPAAAFEATQTVERQYTVTEADGTVVTKRAPADAVKPGEAVVYSINYTNTNAEDASGIVLDMPVPSQVRLAEGSADAQGVRVLYSADGGETFSERLALTVTDADGTVRPAATDDITDLRFALQGAVAPGESGSVGFTARLR